MARLSWQTNKRRPSKIRGKQMIPKESDFYKGYEKGLREGRRRSLPAPLTHPAPRLPLKRDMNVEGLTVHAFIAARNEEENIERVIESVHQAGAHMVIVIANGCTDKTIALAQQAGAETIIFKEPLGHDVGRAVGIQAYPADINLFLDADFVLDANDLTPFINAVASGADIALNDLNPLYQEYAVLDNISLIKLCLNTFIQQAHLGVNSLTAIPHALSRRAVDVLTPEILSVPPKALVKGCIEGLQIVAAHTVDVFKANKVRPELHCDEGKNHMADLIIGDHLEAIAYYLEQTDSRGGYSDLSRHREKIRIR